MSTYGSGTEIFKANPTLGEKTIVGGVISGKTLFDQGRQYYVLINKIDGVGQDDGRVWIYKKDTNEIVGWYDGPSEPFTRGTGADAEEARYFNDPKARKDTYEKAATTLENTYRREFPDAKSAELEARVQSTLNGQYISPTQLNEAQLKDYQLQTTTDIPIADIKGLGQEYGGNYYYPLDIEKNEQDRIKFTVVKKEEKRIEKITSDRIGGISRPTFEELKGSVTLPIQPVIRDNNRVEWAGMTLNPIDAQIAAAAYGAASSNDFNKLLDFTGDTFKRGFDLMTKNSQIRDGLRVYLAQEAAGVQGLLSRTSGAVLNPNMELLFKGPQLRPFSFSFKMSPREKKEARAVRNIIRFFKQNMAVRTTSSNVFLKEPFVFKIEYLTDENDIHPSINRIKQCALLDCSVDYAPDGSYMTFNDEERTMTSYSISLQFQEIEPIYMTDYTDEDSHIGF